MRKMKKLRLITHPRSGTHWVSRTIFENFITPYKKYQDIIHGHQLTSELRREFPNAVILNCNRDIESVLKSVFRMRDRNGIGLSDFSEFIRTPYNKMKKVEGKTNIFFDNKLMKQPRASWIRNQPLTPPMLWLLSNEIFSAYADLTITYEQMQTNQKEIMNKIGKLTKWVRRASCELIDTVGWHPPDNKDFEISQSDKDYLNKFRSIFNMRKESLQSV